MAVVIGRARKQRMRNIFVPPASGYYTRHCRRKVSTSCDQRRVIPIVTFIALFPIGPDSACCSIRVAQIPNLVMIGYHAPILPLNKLTQLGRKLLS